MKCHIGARLGAIKWVAAIMVLLVSSANAGALRPFSSDGCSAFPDGTLSQQNLWLSCCTEHDFSYWKGGSRSERRQADLALHQCVTAVGEVEIAAVMLVGVRVGGSPFFPTRFRWGYGWPYPRFYGVLTAAELAQVERLATQPN